MAQAAASRNAVPSEHLAHLFTVRLEFTSDSPSDAIVPAEGRDGAYIGSGPGTVTGDRVEGATLTFPTNAVHYEWLTDVLAVMEGDFDERAGCAIWHVYAQITPCGKPIRMAGASP